MALQQWAKEAHQPADSTWKHEVILFATCAHRNLSYQRLQKSLIHKADLPGRNMAMQGTRGESSSSQ